MEAVLNSRTDANEDLDLQKNDEIPQKITIKSHKKITSVMFIPQEWGSLENNKMVDMVDMVDINHQSFCLQRRYMFFLGRGVGRPHFVIWNGCSKDTIPLPPVLLFMGPVSQAERFLVASGKGYGPVTTTAVL